MIRTIEATIDKDGRVHLLEPVQLPEAQRAIVTILEEEPRTIPWDPHSPWQKGGVENAIGRVRRTLPRKTDLAPLPAARFTPLLQAYNHNPRKCPADKTPAETLWDSVLHLQCESTFPLARE